MIQFCACTKSSRSSLGVSKSRDCSKLCKSCGGRVPVDGPGARSVSMLSTAGVELPRDVDSHLTWNWKTASNGRSRAVRRARTSFLSTSSMSSPVRSLKQTKHLDDNGAKYTTDMTVSESEKVGVSILGRRFSESLESVPIKKRRIPFVMSPSPPLQSSHTNEDHSPSYQDNVTKSRYGGRKEDGKTELEELGENSCETADFSGISILAAAACDSNIGDSVISEGSVKEFSSGGHDTAGRSSKMPGPFLTGVKEEPLHNSSQGSTGQADVNSDGSCNYGKPNKTRESSSRDVGFPWDLNTVMDVEESCDDEVLKSEPQCTACAEAGQDEESVNVGTCEGQTVFEDTKIGSETGECNVDLIVEGKGIHEAEKIKMEEAPGSSGDLSIAHGDGSTTYGYRPKDLISTAYVSEVTNSSSVANKSCAASTTFLQSIGGSHASQGDSRSSALVEEKCEEHCKSFSSEVEAEKSSSYLASTGNCDEQNTNSFGLHHGSVQGNIKAAASVVVNHADNCCTDGGASCSKNNVIGSALDQVNCLDADTIKEQNAIFGDTEHEEMDAEVKLHSKTAETKIDSTVAKIEVCTAGAEMCASSVKMDGVNCDGADENLNNSKNESGDHVGDEVVQSEETDIPLSTAKNSPKDETFGSQGISGNHADGFVSISQQLALDDHLDRNVFPDASQNVVDRAIGIEKVDYLGDDDSVYEDGEFRQPTAGYWPEDGVEDGEVEPVDYGSDRDPDVYESAPDFCNSNDLQVNNEVLLDVRVRTLYRADAGKNSNTVSPSVLNGPLIDESSGSIVGTNMESFAEESFRGNTGTEDGNMHLVSSATNEGDRELSYLPSSRMKLSKWDQLPRDRRSSSSGPMDPRLSSDSVRRVLGPSKGSDTSSRMERGPSCEGSQWKDKHYDRTSRFYDHNFNPQVDGDACTLRPIGRSRPSQYSRGRGRGERFHDSGRRDSSGYYGPASFPNPGSRNAAADARAKLESNGFVVAPDGTIVKANTAVSSGHLVRGSGRTSSQRNSQSPVRRESLTDRDRLYDIPAGRDRVRARSPVMSGGRGRGGRNSFRMVRRERFNAPMSDDIMDSSYPISRRENSFSPRRRQFHLSRSRSRSSSRSRTRSPPRWASPRGRNGGRINNGPSGLQRDSRSPHFSSEATMARPRPIFRERTTGYAPFSRNNNSPQHTSRWTDRRKEHPENFRGHEYRRYSPPRVFSRDQKYDFMDSSRRPKPSEFYQPINSGRCAEYDGFDRGSRQDRRGEYRRTQNDSYQMHHSGRQYNGDDSTKRLNYNGEGDFRSHNPHPRSSNFSGRVSPRASNRNVGRQLEDAPWKLKQENDDNSMKRLNYNDEGGFRSPSFHPRSSNFSGRGSPRASHSNVERLENGDNNMMLLNYNDEAGFGSHNAQPRSSNFPECESPRALNRNVESQHGDSPTKFKEENGKCGTDTVGQNNDSFAAFGVSLTQGDDNVEACGKIE